MKGVLSYILGLFLGGFCFVSAQETWINCGGEDYVDHFGRPFLADVEHSEEQGYGYEGGVLRACPGSYPPYIPEKYDRVLLVTHHGGDDFKYRFDVPCGEYIVTLFFRDLYGRFPESFPFDVAIEDSVILEDFSIFNESGRLGLTIHRYITEVADNQLELDFTAHYWGRPWPTAQVSAIGIAPFDESVIPSPSPPDEFHVVASYGMNALYWEHSAQLATGGYNIYRASPGELYQILNENPVRTSRYFDETAEPNKTYSYYVTAVDIVGEESAPGEACSVETLDANDSQIPVYCLDLGPENYDSLWWNYGSDDYTDCTFRYENTLCSGGVRFRGHLELQIGTKPGWKIRLSSTHPLIGLKKINLKSELKDPSFLREPLFFLASHRLGIPTIRSRHVHLEVNNEYYGVFLEKEQPGKALLRRFGYDDEGDLFKVISGVLAPCDDDSLYRKQYEKEEGDSADYSNLAGLITLIDTTRQSNIASALSETIDLRNFAGWYALNNIFANEDFLQRNYFLYLPPGKKWIFIPWDCDYTLRYIKLRESVEMFASGNNTHPLYKKFLSVPSFRLAYCNRIYQILSLQLNPATVGKQADSIYSLISIDAVSDVWKMNGDDTAFFDNQVQSVLRNFNTRREYLLSEGIEKSMPFRSSAVRINEIATQPQTWVEIVNAGFYDIDLSGYRLDVELAQNGRWDLPEIILEPGEVIILMESQHDLPPLDPQGGELVIFDRGGEPVDAIFYDYLTPGSSLSREGAGTDSWVILDKPTPGGIVTLVPDRNLEVIPNPICQSAIVNIRLNYPSDYRIAIYDLAGRRVGNFERPNPHSLTDSFQWGGTDERGNELSNGIYFFLASSLDEMIGRQRVVLIR